MKKHIVIIIAFLFAGQIYAAQKILNFDFNNIKCKFTSTTETYYDLRDGGEHKETTDQYNGSCAEQVSNKYDANFVANEGQNTVFSIIVDVNGEACAISGSINQDIDEDNRKGLFKTKGEIIFYINELDVTGCAYDFNADSLKAKNNSLKVVL